MPADGDTVTATATGDLTLHGTTKPVTFDVQATYKNGLIGVLGQIPIVFADYGIPNPSIGHGHHRGQRPAGVRAGPRTTVSRVALR